jgi:hypothetical protein
VQWVSSCTSSTLGPLWSVISDFFFLWTQRREGCRDENESRNRRTRTSSWNLRRWFLWGTARISSTLCTYKYIGTLWSAMKENLSTRHFLHTSE